MMSVSTPTKWNEHQIEEMFALTDSLEIPLRFQGPVSPRNDGDNSPLVIQPLKTTWDRIIEIKQERSELSTLDRGIQYNETELHKRMVNTQKSTCGVGMTGVDIDPYGNVLACMHLQESAGNLHENSIKEIWNHSPLFTKARKRAVEAADKVFGEIPVRQFGAPLYCLAVEENYKKQFKGNSA